MRRALEPTLVIAAPRGDASASPLTPETLAGQFARVRATSGVREMALLATCHRREVYMAVDDVSAAVAAVFGAIETWSLTGPAAAEHLLRVACGLDSPILGDGQILGQVRRAYGQARAAGTTGRSLNRLFERALRAGKRTRHETALGRGTTTAPAAAVRLVERLAGDLSRRQIVVVGAGETAAIAARYLARLRPAAMVIANRTRSRADALAATLGARAVDLSDLPQALAAADIVVSATARADPVISAALLRQVMSARPGRSLLAVDLARPGDVEPAAASLPGVALIGLDRVEAEAAADRETRVASVPAAEAIVAAELQVLAIWRAGAAAAGAIQALRAQTALAWRQAREDGVCGDHRRRRLECRRRLNRALHCAVLELKATEDDRLRLSTRIARAS